MPWARRSTYTIGGVNLSHSFSRFWMNVDGRDDVQVVVLVQLTRNECADTEKLSKWLSVSSPSASMVDENLFKLISRIKIKIPAKNCAGKDSINKKKPVQSSCSLPNMLKTAYRRYQQVVLDQALEICNPWKGKSLINVSEQL